MIQHLCGAGVSPERISDVIADARPARLWHRVELLRPNAHGARATDDDHDQQRGDDGKRRVNVGQSEQLSEKGQEDDPRADPDAN